MPDDDPTPNDPNADPSATPELGEAGKRAIAAERARAAEAERVRKASEKRATELEAELAKLREAGQSDNEKAIERAKRETADAIRKETLGVANRRILTAEIRAAAGGKLADPYDAVRLLDVDSFTVDDSGDVDAKAITKAIDDLLTAKPYLAANAKRFEGSADGGARTVSADDPNVTPGHSRLLAAYSQTQK